ncbi:MAG: PAS domain S-box protein [Gemmatimonadales bacterium]
MTQAAERSDIVVRLRQVGAAAGVAAALLAAVVIVRAGGKAAGGVGLAVSLGVLSASTLIRYRQPHSVAATTLAVLAAGGAAGAWVLESRVASLLNLAAKVAANPATAALAALIILVATALVLERFPGDRPRKLMEWTSFAGLFAGAVVLTGSVLGLDLTPRVTGFGDPAVMFVSLGLLTFAMLARQAEAGSLAVLVDDGVAGEAARRSLLLLGGGMLPVLLLVSLGLRARWYEPLVGQALALGGTLVLGVWAAASGFTRLARAERQVRDAVIESRRNERRFRAAVEAAPSGMLLIDDGGRVVLANRKAVAEFGYSADEMIGLGIEDLIPERFRRGHSSLRRAFQRAPEARPMGRAPAFMARRRDGTEFPGQVVLNPVETTDGTLILASVVNAAERLEAESAIERLNEEVRVNEERFAVAVQGSRDGIWDWNHPSRRLWLSGRARELLGVATDGDVALSAAFANLHPDDREAVATAIRDHLAWNDRLEFEARIRQPEGGVRWLTVKAQALRRNGRLVRTAGSFSETTALHESIAELEESRRRFRVALDNHGVGFWEWELHTDRVEWDDNWRHAHGQAATSPPAGGLWLSLIHPDDRERVQEAIRATLRQADPYFQVEYRARTDEGTFVWVCCRGRVAERSPDGRVTRILGTVEDITAWKRVEALLEHRNRELQGLLHVTSHDLREPLRAILGFSRIISAQHQDQLDPAGHDYLGRVVRAASRLEQLINDIWTLSRARRIERPPAPIATEGLAQNAVASLETRIAETRATVAILPGLPVLPVDPTWVTQAVYNLVLNALKFTQPGAPPEIEIGPFPAGGETNGIVVRDRGPGVPPEHAERIFRLFQRAVGREVEGTGAGLAIVREVAERHGGRAWVQGRAGGGSEFVVTLSEAAVALRPQAA